MGGRAANNSIPVLLAYDQSHYESLVPDTEVDIQKTVDLKQRFLGGFYSRNILDIPVLRDQVNVEKKSYAGALKRNINTETDAKKEDEFQSSGIKSLPKKNWKMKQSKDKTGLSKAQPKTPPQKRMKKTTAPQKEDELPLYNRFASLSEDKKDSMKDTVVELNLEDLKNIAKK